MVTSGRTGDRGHKQLQYSTVHRTIMNHVSCINERYSKLDRMMIDVRTHPQQLLSYCN